MLNTKNEVWLQKDSLLLEILTIQKYNTNQYSPCFSIFIRDLLNAPETQSKKVKKAVAIVSHPPIVKAAP